MPAAAKLSGQRFGRLIALRRSEKRSASGGVLWVCRCDCGKQSFVQSWQLKSGRTKSCGCLGLELRTQARTTHGHTRKYQQHPLYNIWKAMRGRCTNPNTPNFQNYGGRGIRVCDRWNDGDGTLSGFACFLADMGERPDGLTLDRIDNDKGYEPGNCRWATWTQQQNNRRSNIDVEAVMALRRQGLTKRDIAKRLGKNKDTVAIAILRATSGKEAQP